MNQDESRYITRRAFGKLLAALSPGVEKLWGGSFFSGTRASGSGGEAAAEQTDRSSAVPFGPYTPFGYLDNPYHYWALHRSGVLRSVPPIGMGLYYPAGPGGYFDYGRNSIYRIFLRLGFKLNGRIYFEEEDFESAGIELISPYHSKNILSFQFSAKPFTATASFYQVDENSLAGQLSLRNLAQTDQEARVYAVSRLELGAAEWWGRDGIAGCYDHDRDQATLRSFAAGPVFGLHASTSSATHFVSGNDSALRKWMEEQTPPGDSSFCYFPQGMNAGLGWDLKVPARNTSTFTFILSRGEDRQAVDRTLRSARSQAAMALDEKRREDGHFWSRAPQLEGDFPAHWKHSWVYDFETLRMMVRHPRGVYKHRWDAMQIQAPRNVLAETSIDMWTLAYADESTAKSVLLGQFEDALDPNVPCMREDGTMNMVAVDGSACGTALQWCYPFYCLQSVFLRTLDREWLTSLYPYLAKYLEWTLKNRRDSEGFIVGKCSWETGMDSSRRFLINQPTGGELINFIRVAELQAAMSQAARSMKQYASLLGKSGDIEHWDRLAMAYAQKTQQLWYEGWFYDVDARTGRPIMIPGHREITQVGPVMCGVATADQIRQMIPEMRAYEHHQEFWLEWPSHVLPYAESLWRAGERPFLARILYQIIERVYQSMDRRQIEPEKKLGWPGVSCEMWGLNGARGGEGYGWGATLPAHIVRSIFGFREGDKADGRQFTLGPNLPDALLILRKGKAFGLRNVHYRGQAFDLHYERLPGDHLSVEIAFLKNEGQKIRVKNEGGTSLPVSSTARGWRFQAQNHALYQIEI